MNAQQSKPFSLPHTAPTRFLGASLPDAGTIDIPAADLTEAEERAELIRYHMDALEELAGVDRRDRVDGWTGIARKIFLNTLAHSGEVGKACHYAGLSRQSAYALRARDPVFAAGWDAASELARSALADAMLERAMAGTTETITRNGEVIAEKHRFDGRLAMSVLHRLDARADRAAEQGTAHLRALGQWEHFLDAVGEDDDAAAEAMLAPPPPPEPEPRQPESTSADDKVWFDDGRACWMTSLAPPEGFTGYADGFGPINPFYERACTEEEAALLNRYWPDAATGEDDSLQQVRDSFFAELAAELDAELDAKEESALASPQPMLHDTHAAD